VDEGVALSYPKQSFVPKAIQPAPGDLLDQDVDPTTYEVVRHRLLMINDEVSSTVYSTSGSPVVAHGRDFNSGLLTGRGEYVYFGQYVQIHAGFMDLGVRFVLERMLDSPGANPGDAFIMNDPWISSGHVNDVTCVSPFHVDGEILLWVVNTVHHIDMGGSGAASRNLRATSSWEEGTIIPPVKLVEGGQYRLDVSAMIERQSRMSDYTALDLRAQAAGNMAGIRRLTELVDEFGAQTVRAVGEGVVEHSARVFQRKLEQIPDGVWRERTYIDGAKEGDRHAHRVAMRLEKQGSKLIFSDDGSDEQLLGPINGTYASWRSGITCSMLTQLGSDTPFMTGGLLRHTEFVHSPGTILQADFPAPVNRGTSIPLRYAGILSSRLISRMATCDPDQRAKSIATASGSEPLLSVGLTGRKDNGSRLMRVFVDTIGCGSGAQFGHDGDDTGGAPSNLGAIIPNVEDNEAAGGLLYIYRREEPDTSGPGHFRGGKGIGFAIVPHGATDVSVNLAGCGVAFPPTAGMFGGYPSGARFARVVRQSGVWDRGSDPWPSDDEHLIGQTEVLEGKLQGVRLDGDDVLVIVGGGGNGIGDPLQRTPSDVERDVEAFVYTKETADRLYSLTTTEASDSSAAQPRRVRGTANASADQPSTRRVGPHPDVYVDASSRYRCARCEHDLGPDSGWYVSELRHVVRPLGELGLGYQESVAMTDADITLHEYFCPGCATLLEVDIAPEHELLPESKISWTTRSGS
jgi:N-methylhydantoinase B